MAADGCGSTMIKSPSYASFQKRHDEGDHLVVFKEGSFSYLSVPPLLSQSVEDKDGKLCFVAHQTEAWDSLSEMCCLREAGHVHAHVHRGEITEDVLLEQCMEEAGCTLPMPWDMGSMKTPVSSGGDHDSDHEHQDGCGHNRIAHGDHYDWLVPLNDGSYVLSHPQATDNGGSQFIEHGRLVKIGESLGQLKRRPRELIDLFTYVGPKRKGYESLPTIDDDDPGRVIAEIVAIAKSPSSGCMVPSPTQAVVPEDMVKLNIPWSFKSQGMTKTTFDVMGICCPSEVPLVKKILAPLPGVEEVLVNPTAKTVMVLHDPLIVTDLQLVKLLNEARLDATIHQRGERRSPHKWPSPWTMGSGVLLLISFLHYAYPPLKWIALGSVAVGIPPILVRSLVSLRRCILDINALMLIAVGGAIALGDYVEAGSIAFLFTLADWLESRSSGKARDAISNVADLAPQTVVLMDGQRVGVEDVSIGTLLAVKAGELIPIDGEVVSGKSSVDESNVTGESKPIEKITGAVVWAGTMNLSGYISVKTTALAEDSAVSRMVRLVEEAQNQHSPTEQLVQRVAKYYTPVIVATAVLIAVIPWAAGSHRHKHWIYLALVLLVVACPCALVISTPVTTTCGIAQAARAGLLVRGGSYLEALAKVRIVAMDKTGTLTEGHFRVLDVRAVGGATDFHQILYWIACVESKSSHPLAPALVAFARLNGVEATGNIMDYENIPGLGVSAVVDGRNVQIGNKRLASTFTNFEADQVEIIETWSSQGATVGWVGVDGRVIGVFGVADSVRSEAVEAVASLKRLGTRVVMLTGDSAAAASAIHNQIGDIEVHAELLPEDKVARIKDLKENGITAMVGDGINDAPALALADVGIAMGVAGSAVAMETADVALMTNDLRKLAVAIDLGQNVRWKIVQNVCLSFLTKLVIIVLAVVGYPSLWGAVLADVGTCLVVIFNSMRLLNRKKGVVLPKFESKSGRDHKLCVSHGHVLDHHQHHHELGKIEETNGIHHHHEELDNLCDHDHHPSHDHSHSTDHHHQHHGSYRFRMPFFHRKHNGGGKGHEEDVQVTADHRRTCEQDATDGWPRVEQPLSGVRCAKSRKCCTSNAPKNCCQPDSRDALSSQCCKGSNNHTKDLARGKKACRMAAPAEPALLDSGCGSDPVNTVSPEGSATRDDEECCAEEGPNVKSFSSRKACAISASASRTQCCQGQDRGKPCTGEGADVKPCSKASRKTCADAATTARSQCCGAQNPERTCCSDQKSKSTSGKVEGEVMTVSHRGHHAHIDKGNPRNSGASSRDSGYNEAGCSADRCCEDSREMSRIPSSSRAMRGQSGEECCPQDLSELTSGSTSDSKKESCCSASSCSQGFVQAKGGSSGLSSCHKEQGRLQSTAPAAEKPERCGRARCKLADHSKCAKEALMHSPLRETFSHSVSQHCS